MKIRILLLFVLIASLCPISFASKGSFNAQTISVVDKTPFLKAIIEDKNKVVLITRPHSWGGTFNLGNVENFFSPNVKSDCCHNKVVDVVKRQKLEQESIAVDKHIMNKYFGQYPTISISFRTSKIKDKDHLRSRMISKIKNMFVKYAYLEHSHKLSPDDIEMIQKYSSRNANLTDDEIKNSVRFLSDMMYKHFEMPVIILFNKYDDFAKSHASDLLEAGMDLKEDDYIKYAYDLHGGIIYNALHNNHNLFKSLIMGTTKVSGMKIWDKIKHSEDSLFNPKWGDYFGFTLKELFILFEEYDVGKVDEKTLARIKKFYGGYKLGNQDIYHPAPIMRMLESYRSYKELRFDFYRHVPIVGDFSSPARKGTIKNLASGKTIDITIDPDISYLDAGTSSENFYAILVMEGFLAITKATELDNGKYKCRVKIPNEEMKIKFNNLIGEDLGLAPYLRATSPNA